MKTKKAPIKVRQERVPLSDMEKGAIRQCIAFEEKVLATLSGLTPEKRQKMEDRVRLLKKRLAAGYYVREVY
jgi:hypothetical protein